MRLCELFKILQENLGNVRKFLKNKQNYLRREKDFDQLILKKKLNNYFVNNFLVLLLCKGKALEIFNTVDFIRIFIVLRNREIFIVLNFWLGL